MADLKAIRKGLAAQLKDVYGGDVQVSAYLLTDPTPPTIVIAVGPTDYDTAMERGGDVLTLIVTAFVPLDTDIGAQITLDMFLDDSNPKAMKAAIEKGRPAGVTFGGVCDDARVTRCSGEKPYTLLGHQELVLGADWTVEVEV